MHFGEGKEIYEAVGDRRDPNSDPRKKEIL
jgi:hypothetical protein